MTDDRAPTSTAALRRHRAANANGPASVQLWLFHAHVYFDHAVAERRAEARRFMELIQATFTDGHVEVHAFIPFPAGPHPRGSFEVLFTREAFVEHVTWMMFARPPSLDVLIHPLTRSQVLDHGPRAFWLGTPLALETAVLAAADALLEAAGRSEESIIEATKRHELPAPTAAR
jgi:aromatic ring-cleaving dioxygenase